MYRRIFCSPKRRRLVVVARARAKGSDIDVGAYNRLSAQRGADSEAAPPTTATQAVPPAAVTILRTVDDVVQWQLQQRRLCLTA